ncbi:YceI family protein [Streptomyces sp. NRRL F-5126]|uniref:YceI family protein n=1 Tax=Streptomyces sp. NRRL F-5126 TaxID=1463857 RepID=UPI0004CAC728|nr:YceI family protein [Streptomyces sp. NRRL F-5126]
MGLRAQVRTRDGWAVQHAVVTLTDTNGSQVLRADADADGVVTAPDTLAPGPYTVVVTAIGYTPSAATALVTASGRADIGTVVLARQGGFELPPPGSWSIDPAHSTVSAVAQHLGLASVHGRFNEFGGTIEIVEDGGEYIGSHVEATIAAASIDTGNGLRDKHLKSPDFLDVEAFPDITFRSTSLVPAGTDRWTVHGKLALHGVERDVDLALSYLGSGSDPWGGVRAAFSATTELRREDYAMNFNQVVQAGVAMVGAVLKVELHIEAVQGELPPMM